jgi:hypothetical protein
VLSEAAKRQLFKTLKYEPHSEEQWECHLSPARFKIPCCGRRWGKTTFGGNELTAAALETENIDTSDPPVYWIVGPNYALGEKEFRVLYQNLVKKLGLGNRIKKQYNVNQGQMRIEMPWGTVIEVKSADRKDGLVGEGLNGVVMAEAASHDKDTWDMYVRPALSDRRGWAIFPSTPRGYNWYQGMWMMGQLPDFPEYESWRLPTWTNKARYPKGLEEEEMIELKRITPETTWLQEYAADFVAYQGKIYTEFIPKIHIKEIPYNPAWRNYLVFDYGFADPFVCLDIMVDPSDNVYVWREYQVTSMSTWEHGQIIRNRKNPPGYHIDGMFGDPRGADEAATLALILGPVLSEPVGWKLGIEAVKAGLKLQPDGQPKLFFGHTCEHLNRQMERLHFIDVKEGKNHKEMQHDFDDHGPDALRYFYNHMFVLGVGPRLSDIYNAATFGSEAMQFFTQESIITRDENKSWV